MLGRWKFLCEWSLFRGRTELEIFLAPWRIPNGDWYIFPDPFKGWNSNDTFVRQIYIYIYHGGILSNLILAYLGAVFFFLTKKLHIHFVGDVAANARFFSVADTQWDLSTCEIAVFFFGIDQAKWIKKETKTSNHLMGEPGPSKGCQLNPTL